MNPDMFGDCPDEMALDRLRGYAEIADAKHPDGYWLAYSGGKDSVVLLDLARRAGVKFRAVHNLTTCDPPELVQFIRQQEGVEIHKPEMSMWRLIRKKGMPPRRNARYCCEVLKERGGQDHIVLTGVRWGESARRSKRQMVEACYRDKSKHYMHPIIDWTTGQVWEYIRERDLPYCSLYDEGFRRVGCILCPLVRDTKRQIARWPRIARAWERAVKATYKPFADKTHKFDSADAYWEWWLDRDAPALGNDYPLFDDGGSE